MDRLDEMRVFLAVADAGGFAMAARRLGISPPAATRAVASLEERIGARLLHRTTRIVRRTEAGDRFLADCRRILGEIDDAEAAAAGSHAEPRGRIAVTAPASFGRLHVAPVVLAFLIRHPEVAARLMLVDRVVDLIEEGLDVAVRIAHLADSSLSASRVGAVRRIVCASPTYLAARGVPRRPADLVRFEAIAFSQAGALPGWSFAAGARTEMVNPPTPLIVNSAEVAVAAAVAGQGLTRVLSYQAAAELQAGRLEIVLAEFEPPPIPVHVVHAEGRRAAARVRAFVDFAVERLRADPALR
jgi:DNA-binding transcriptional LysR family regulator